MSRKFRMKELVDGVAIDYEGRNELSARRPLPIPAHVPMRVHRVTSPSTLHEVSYRIYRTTEMWALLAEWNAMNDFVQYQLIEARRIPSGTLIRYMSMNTYRALLELRPTPTLTDNQDAQVTITEENIGVPVVSAPNQELYEQLSISNREVQMGGVYIMP